MDRNKIINHITSADLMPIELEDEDFPNVKILKSNSLDELLKIAKDSERKRIYFGYTNYDPGRFKVKYNPDNLSKKGNEKLEFYNKYVDSLDFTRPYKVTIFIEIDFFLLGITIVDDWIQGEDLSYPDMILEVVKEEDEDHYYEEVFEKRRKVRTSKKDDLEKLLEIILNDPEFAYKKNQQSRYWYFHELMEKEEMKKYIDLLMPYGAPHTGNLKMFLDDAWRSHKERVKEEKNKTT